jgi:hypothetical protein
MLISAITSSSPAEESIDIGNQPLEAVRAVSARS